MNNIAKYQAERATEREQDDRKIAEALHIIQQRMRTEGIYIESSTDAKNYCALKMGNLEREEFHVLFLSNELRLLADRHMFTGTVNQVGTHIREIAKAALALNASNVIYVHNHPDQEDPTPSNPDKLMTADHADLLKNLDITLLDHYIVGGSKVFSMRQNQLMDKLRESLEESDMPDFLKAILGKHLGDHVRGKINDIEIKVLRGERG